ncbi:LOW QUALITY PROTEIN: uncharacterized protein [Panulirus ornatus]|uniref:LOW QUALITY PROTEIN: uncharacterized protein n=1 Tax=Panulirus ornatus TaxID=150431 RepID=UPI003A841F64
MVRARTFIRLGYERPLFLVLCVSVVLVMYNLPLFVPPGADPSLPSSFLYPRLDGDVLVEPRARHEENWKSDNDIDAKFTRKPDTSSTYNTGSKNNNNNTGGNPSHHKLLRRTLLPDLHRRSLSQWPGDPQCRQFRVRFGEVGTLPLCALASYPGSGNTWTRHLLEAASGVFTGSTYRDQQLFMNGYLGELDSWTSRTTFTQKTHECNPAHIKAFNGTGILLIRNPYRAILSYHNFLFGGHTGYAPVSNYRRKDWNAFLHVQTRYWLEMAINWTTQTKALHVLHYEHLKEDPVTHLSHVLDFYGLPRNPRRLQCLKEHEDRNFKRREEFIPSNLEIFSVAIRDKIDRAVRYVDYLLRQRRHPPLPLHLYEFYNNTHSAQMVSVPCLPGETTAVCDARVERLNHSRRRPKAGKDRKSPNRTTVATKNVTTVEETGGRSLKLAGGQVQQDPLERFASTKVGWLMTKMFNTIMRQGWTDPITNMVSDGSPLELPGVTAAAPHSLQSRGPAAPPPRLRTSPTMGRGGRRTGGSSKTK